MDRATRYDAIIATLVGISALLVSAYTAYIQRQQVRAQVYPIVQLTSGYSDTDVHVILSNKGSGPALIRNVQVSVDGKPVHDWLGLVGRAIGEDHSARDLSYSSFSSSVLAPGEESHVLTLSCVNRAQAKLPTELASLGPSDEVCARMMKLIGEASFSICYCSTLNECFVWEDGPHRAPSTTESRRCPASSADSFN